MTGLKPALEAGPFLGAEVVHKDMVLRMVGMLNSHPLFALSCDNGYST